MSELDDVVAKRLEATGLSNLSTTDLLLLKLLEVLPQKDSLRGCEPEAEAAKLEEPKMRPRRGRTTKPKE